MSELESLMARADELTSKVDFWNSVVLWALLVTALAAGALVFSQGLAFVRAKQLASVQDEIAHIRDEKLAELGKQTAEANKAAEAEKLARVRLEKQIAPRRLAGEDKDKFTKLLQQYPDPVGVVVVSAMLDGESSDFADDFNAAITDAKWKTLVVKNRLTQKTGVSLGIVEGTPPLDPWKRPIVKLKQRLADALTAIGVSYQDVTFGKDDLHSTNPAFEPGPIYLVIEHKPQATIEK